jgi:hypothetical protein
LKKDAVPIAVKIYTVSFRRVFEDSSLLKTEGLHLYTLNWKEKGLDLANGFYYLVFVSREGGKDGQKVMKIIMRK